jgi:Rrf2 family cysteine metabolism transcriptional repressor
MKISVKGQYALESLLELARSAKNGQASLHTIAQRRNLSVRFLGQIFATLRRAGIVTGVRGVLGGYRLAKPPGKITVGAVVRALEGPLVPVKCVCSSLQEPGRCILMDTCVTRDLWISVTKEIDSTLDDVTLEDLMASCKETA